MENNFNESLNLGNMVSSGYANANITQQSDNQVQAPVFETTTFSSQNEPVIIQAPQQNINTMQNMHLEVSQQEVAVASSPVPPTPPVPPTDNTQEQKIEHIVYDEIIVPTTLLKSLVSAAKKVATYEALKPKTQVIGLEFGNFGIKVNASNGRVDYECVDSNVTYSTTMKICVDIKLLDSYLAKCDEFDSIKFAYNSSNVLTVVLPNGGEAPLPEKVDSNTQQPVDLDLVFPIKYEDLVEMDYEQFINSISQSKPIRDIPLVDNSFSGTYFSNLVISSDRSIIYIQDNQQILKTQKFFVGAELCKLLMELSFNAKNFRVGFTTDTNNDIRALTLSDGRLTICGNVEPTAPIDEEVCNKFWNAQFEHSYTVNTKKLSGALQRLGLFNNSERDDYADLEVSGSNLKITMATPIAKENVTVEGNVTGYAGVKRLPLTKLNTILKSIKAEKITISVDSKFETCVGIKADDYKWIVAIYNG